MEKYVITPLVVVVVITLVVRGLRRRFPSDAVDGSPPEHHVAVRVLWAIPPVLLIATTLSSMFVLAYLDLGPRLDIGLVIMASGYFIGMLISWSIAQLAGPSLSNAYSNYLERRSGLSRKGQNVLTWSCVLLIFALTVFLCFRGMNSG